MEASQQERYTTVGYNGTKRLNKALDRDATQTDKSLTIGYYLTFLKVKKVLLLAIAKECRKFKKSQMPRHLISDAHEWIN